MTETGALPPDRGRTDRPGRPRRNRRRAVLLGAAVLLVLSLAFVDRLTLAAAHGLARRSLPWTGAEVSIGAARMRPGQITLSDLRIAAGPGDDLRLDTLRIRFALRELLTSPRRLRNVHVSGLHVNATRRDSTWAWIAPFSGGGDGGADTAFRLDGIAVERGSVRAIDQSGNTIFEVDGIGASIDSVRTGADLAAVLSAGLRLRHGRLPGGQVGVAGSARIAEGAWTVDSLVIEAGGGGRLRFEGSVGSPGPAGMSLAGGFQGRDIGVSVLVRAAGTDERFDVDATVTGTVRSPRIDGRVAFHDAGEAAVMARLDRTAGHPVLTVQTTTEGIDVARFGGEPPARVLGGTLEATLTVAHYDSIDGPVTFDVMGSSTRVSGSATFERGVALVAADVRTGEFRSRVRGRIRPFGRPQFNLEAAGRIEAPVPDWLVRVEPDWRGPWDTRARLVGEGSSLNDVEAVFVATVEPIARSARTGPVRIRGRVAGGSARLEATGELAGGLVEGTGSVNLSDPAALWSVDTLTLTGIGTAPWIGGSDGGRLDARVSVRPAGAAVTAVALIDSVVGGRLDGVSGRVAGAGRHGRFHLTGALVRGPQAVRIHGLDLSSAGLDRARIDFASIDPAAWSDRLPEGVVTGEIKLGPSGSAGRVGTGDFLRDTRVEGSITIDTTSTLGRAPIHGTGRIALLDGEITVDAAFEGAGQRLALAGSAVPRGAARTIRLDRTALANVDPSVWSGGRLPSARISGTGSARLAGFDPTTAEASVDLALDSTRVGVLALDSGRLTVDLIGGVARLTGRGLSGDRRGTLDAAARLVAAGAWSGDGTVLVTSVVSPEATDSLRLRYALTGPDRDGVGGWRGQLAGDGAIGGLVLDSLEAFFAVRDGALTIDDVAVVGPDVELRGGGVVPLDPGGDRTARFGLTGTASDIGPVLAIAGLEGYRGTGRFDLRTDGPAASMRHGLTLAFGGVRGRGVEIDSVRLDIAGFSDSTRLLAGASVRVTVGGRRPLLLSPSRLPVLAGLGSSGAFGTAAPGALRARADWLATEPRALRLEALDASIDGEPWVLDRPASIRWDNALAIDSIRVSSPTGHVAIAGRIDRAGDQQLAVAVEALPIQLRRPDAQRALAGRLDLEARLSGPAADPRLDLDGRMAAPAASGLGVLAVNGGWSADGLRVRVGETGDSTGFSIDGVLPVRLDLSGREAAVRWTDDPVDLRVRSAGYDLAALSPLLDGRSAVGLRGMVVTDVHVAGTRGDPRFEGMATVERFALELPGNGIRLDSDRLAVSLAGDRASVTEAVVRSNGGGSVRVEGGIEFPALTIGRLDFEAGFDRFEAIDNGAAQATLSGTLVVAGTLEAPDLSGRLSIDQATYQVAPENVPSRFEPVELTEADYREMERRFGLGPAVANRTSALSKLLHAAAIDVEMTAQSNVWARRAFEPALAIELGGTVRLSKAGEADYRLDGELRVLERRSYLEQYGRRFDITSGTISFNGPPESTEVRAQATYQPTGDVTIRLDVETGSNGLSVDLASEPAMDESDIVSYIAVGRSATDAFAANAAGEDAAVLGTGIGLSRIGSGVENAARQALGLDVVELRQDGIKGLMLVAGRYVSRDLYLGLQQAIGFRTGQGSRSTLETFEVDVEYRLSTWLLTNLSASRSLARLFLRTRHAY